MLVTEGSTGYTVMATEGILIVVVENGRWKDFYVVTS